MKKLVSLAMVLVLLFCAMPLMACCDGGGTAEYRIGALVAVSGHASNLGEPEKQTLQMLEAEINAAGGINGTPVRIIIYDTETDQTTCLTALKRLIEQDNVLAVIGPSTSGESLAIKDNANEDETPLVSMAADDAIVTPVGESYWIFKTPQATSMVVSRVLEYIDAQGLTEIAIISASDGFGALGREELIDQAPDFGITIVADESFDADDTSMSTQLTVINGESPEAVVCWSTDKAGAVVAKNMDSLHMEMPLLMSHGIANRDFITAAGDSANGVIFPVGKLPVADLLPDTDPQKTALLEYTADFEALYGEGTVDTFGGHAWDSFMLVTDAIQSLVDQGLTVDRAGIRDEIETAQLVGISGVFNMSATDHLGLSPDCLVLVEIVDGEWTLLED